MFELLRDPHRDRLVLLIFSTSEPRKPNLTSDSRVKREQGHKAVQFSLEAIVFSDCYMGIDIDRLDASNIWYSKPSPLALIPSSGLSVHHS